MTLNSFLRKEPWYVSFSFPEVTLCCSCIALLGTPLSSHSLERDTGPKIWFPILVTWKTPNFSLQNTGRKISKFTNYYLLASSCWRPHSLHMEQPWRRRPLEMEGKNRGRWRGEPGSESPDLIKPRAMATSGLRVLWASYYYCQYFCLASLSGASNIITKSCD